MLCSYNTRLRTKKWGQTFDPHCNITHYCEITEFILRKFFEQLIHDYSISTIFYLINKIRKTNKVFFYPVHRNHGLTQLKGIL